MDLDVLVIIVHLAGTCIIICRGRDSNPGQSTLDCLHTLQQNFSFLSQPITQVFDFLEGQAYKLNSTSWFPIYKKKPIQIKNKLLIWSLNYHSVFKFSFSKLCKYNKLYLKYIIFVNLISVIELLVTKLMEFHIL
jgi:hypothetical protein